MKALFLLPALLFCLNVHPLCAEASTPPAPPPVTTLKTLGGKTYEGIISIKREPNKLRILHSTGSTTVRLDELDEPSRRIFQYDPNLAAAADAADADLARQQAAAEAQQEEQLASIADSSARKKAARNYVIAHGYRDDRFASEWKSSRDTSAIKTLIRAGYDPASAAMALEEIKKSALANKARYDPAFTTPQGQLRGVPNGTSRNR